jgi:FAD/FMN-containing dehydrogenase
VERRFNKWFNLKPDYVRLVGSTDEVISAVEEALSDGKSMPGAFINHPDTDLADPALNTSGVPWHTLYYQENYPRLQRVKARWDPRNVFHHALSIA